ncbi:MAG: oxidoreductase [Bacteroidales bacterium]|nr:oxidoreductase [Bacteroidales bacterium]
MKDRIAILSAAMLLLASCAGTSEKKEIVLVTLDPGHFHSALVQKTRLPGVSKDVYVYAPDGADLDAHLGRIEAYNSRPDDPTDWNEIVYRGDDFLQRMTAEVPGNVVVISGNNSRKTEYIRRSLEAGLNVLGDKPMAINAAQYDELRNCFEIARSKGLLLYDVMTERFEITTVLQKELSAIPAIFGTQKAGTPEEPGVIMTSVHNFYKNVSGSALIRPAWFYDVRQQGESITDVMTHLVDLVGWECFPEQALYPHDVVINSSRRWYTTLSAAQFKASTGLDEYPEFLAPDVQDGVLKVLSNGEINYCLKGINARVTALWQYETPEGGDSHFSMLRGTKSDLVIRQGADGGFLPQLYIEPSDGSAVSDDSRYANEVTAAFAALAQRYPGIELEPLSHGWHVLIPDSYRVGHEAHFAQVESNFLEYLEHGTMPAWEEPCTLTKYFITTRARELGKIE